MSTGQNLNVWSFDQVISWNSLLSACQDEHCEQSKGRIEGRLTLTAAPPNELLHDVRMALKLLNRYRRLFVGVHLKRRLSSLRQAQHTLAKRQVACAPHGIRSIDDDIRGCALRVPDLDSLVQRAGYELITPVVCPVNPVNLGFVSTYPLNGQ